MEIVGGSGGAGNCERTNAVGFDGDDVVLILEDAVDEKKALVDHGDAILREKLRGDDGVGDAGFVLDAEEYESFGGAGALAGDDGTGDAESGAVRETAKLDGGADALTLERGAMVSHGMTADGESGAAKVGDEAFLGSHGGERRSGGRIRVM